MEFHEYNKIFPRMNLGDFNRLARDIEEHGLLEPIVVHNNKIIDGKNRYFACMKAGVTPIFVNFHGKEKDILNYIVSKNLCRRHIPPVDIHFLREQVRKELNSNGIS